MSSSTYDCTRRHNTNELNDWLCAQVSKANSLDALLNIAKNHTAYLDDAKTMRVVAKVWCDYLAGKLNPRGHVTKFKRRLMLRTDPRRGAPAIVLLMELRCHWRLADQFVLSSRAKNRGVVRELRREAFEGAVDVLLQAGCIKKLRAARYAQDGNHTSALYGLTPVRDNGDLPEMKERTAQEPRRKPQAAKEQSSASDTHQKETPSTSPPEASIHLVDETPPARPSEGPARHVDEVVVARTQKLQTVLQPGEDLHEHIKWISAHRKAELANKRRLVPEFIWEVWKRVFDYPVPMTQTEQTAIDNIAAEFKAVGDETVMSAAEIYEYLRMLRGPKIAEPGPASEPWEEAPAQPQGWNEAMGDKCRIFGFDLDPPTPRPEPKPEPVAPLPVSEWPPMSEDERKQIAEVNEKNWKRYGQAPLSYEQMVEYVEAERKYQQHREQEWQQRQQDHEPMPLAA